MSSQKQTINDNPIQKSIQKIGRPKMTKNLALERPLAEKVGARGATWRGGD